MLQVHITDGYFGDGVKIFIVDERSGTDLSVLRINPDAPTQHTWEPAAPATDIEPTLIFNGEIGRALADALVRHYQGAEDTRTLRRDYDAALQRGERQDQVIADVVRSLAARTGATS